MCWGKLNYRQEPRTKNQETRDKKQDYREGNIEKRIERRDVKIIIFPVLNKKYKKPHDKREVFLIIISKTIYIIQYTIYNIHYTESQY